MRHKLIEVALPLEAINKAAVREKSIRHGHPSTLHLWWARRPLAAARAVIFAQMVDDPSSRPDLFPTHAAQDLERQRLFRLIEELVLWENTSNDRVLRQARKEIQESWQRTCEDNKDHPHAREQFDPQRMPGFHDPFAGGGTLPLEAQRLGLDAFASDLNPVAVIINKAMIEIPPKFAGRPPVNPESRADKKLVQQDWRGAQGLADDVRYYGQWLRDEAEKRIGHLYPPVHMSVDMTQDRPDLRPLVGKSLTVIAWLWARTVQSPNPAFAHVHVPLVSTFMLSTKTGKESHIEPCLEHGNYRFKVRMGVPTNLEAAMSGTSAGKRKAFRCILSGVPISYEHIRTEGMAGRMSTRLLAVVAESEIGRVFLTPTEELADTAWHAHPQWTPDCPLPKKHRNFQPPAYGMSNVGDLFTARQLVALTTLADLVSEARALARRHAVESGWHDDGKALATDGIGPCAYADAIAVYLALAVSRTANTINALAVWSQSREQTVNLFSRQAIPMAWDFPEVNPFGRAAGDFGATTASVAKTIVHALERPAWIVQADAQAQTISASKVVSTDPPYYDNVAYADLSDFFYVWLRRSLQPVLPGLFTTLAVPKTAELVASPTRHGGSEKAEAFFLDGMTRAMRRIAEQSHPAFPVTIYYAFKQSESEGTDGNASTGWETFLDAVIRAGFAVTGTWPMRTERPTGVKSGMNVLASSIILVCRPSATGRPTATRRDFLHALRTELPSAVSHLQHGNIAPVDLAQSAIGPGMAVFTRYEKVLDNKGDPMRVREALTLINETLDESLAHQEGDYDSDSRFALVWFDQHGFDEGDFGVADVLSRAKNTSVRGMEEAGILMQKGGKVRLFKPNELPLDWDPATDTRLTAWESVHHLVRALESGGEESAAKLARNLGSKAESARELAYRLYTLCERKKRAAEALSYNALVQCWPEITRRAAEGRTPTATQQEFI